MNFFKMTYSGAKPYRDKVMGLTWLPGDTNVVTAEAAKYLRRFAEFALTGNASPAGKAASKGDSARDVQAVQHVQGEETQKAMLAAQQAARAAEQEEDVRREMLMTVDSMDKNALEAYASKYEVNLDKRRSVQDLRAQVATLIDQYGVR